MKISNFQKTTTKKLPADMRAQASKVTPAVDAEIIIIIIKQQFKTTSTKQQQQY